MSVAFGASGSTATGVASLSIPYPSGITAGQILVCSVVNKRPGGFEGASTPAGGWNTVSFGGSAFGSDGTNDEGSVFTSVFWKIADGTESGNLSVSLSGSTNVCVGVISRYTSTSGLAIAVGSSGIAGGVSPSISVAGGSLTVATGDLIVVTGGINSDNYTYSGHTISLSGATFGTVNVRADAGSATPTGVGLLVVDAQITAGSGSAAPTWATTASGSATNSPGAYAVFLRIFETTGITYITAGAAAVGSTTLSVPYPTGLVSGDKLLLCVVNKYPTNGPSTPAGWTLATDAQGSGGAGASGADAGLMYSTVFHRTSDGTETGNLSVTLTSSNSAIGRIVCYRAPAGRTWAVAAHNGADNSAGTAVAMTAGGNPGITADDMIVMCVGLNTDARTYSAQAVTATGISAWGTVAERNDSTTTTGDDCALVISEHPVTTGTAVSAPAFVATASGTAGSQNAGAAVFFRLRSTAGANAYTLTAVAAAFVLTVNAANLSASAHALAVSTGVFVETGNPAGLSKQSKLVAAPASFVETVSAAALSKQSRIVVSAGVFSLAGSAAGGVFSRKIVLSAGVFSASFASALFAVAMPATVGSFALSFAASGLAAGRKIVAASAAFSLAASPVLFAVSMPAASVAFSLSVSPVVLRRALVFSAASAAFLLAGSAAPLVKRSRLVADSSTFALVVGSVGLITEGAALAADPAAFVLAVSPARLARDAKLALASGVFAFAGAATGLAAGRRLVAAPASFALVASASRLAAARVLVASSSPFVLAGNAARLAAGRRITASPASYALVGSSTGQALANALAAAPGVFVLDVSPARLARSSRLAVASASFAIAGSSARLAAGRLLAAAPASYLVAGGSAGLSSGRRLAAAPGVFALSFAATGLAVGRALAAAPGIFVLSGSGVVLTRGSVGGTSYTLPTTGGVFGIFWPEVILAYGRVFVPVALGVDFDVGHIGPLVRFDVGHIIPLVGFDVGHVEPLVRFEIKEIGMSLRVGAVAVIPITTRVLGKKGNVDALAIAVTSPSGVRTTYVLGTDAQLEYVPDPEDATKETGDYRAKIPCSASGDWIYDWIASGETIGVESGGFHVDPLR